MQLELSPAQVTDNMGPHWQWLCKMDFLGGIFLRLVCLRCWLPRVLLSSHNRLELWSLRFTNGGHSVLPSAAAFVAAGRRVGSSPA